VTRQHACTTAAATALAAALSGCGPKPEPAPAPPPAAAAAPWAMGAVHGAGVPFGARDPRTCPNINTGKLSQVEAQQLFICDAESVRGADEALELVSEVTLNLGAARRFTPATDASLDDANANWLVYPIFGSYRGYDCAPLGPNGTPAANCALSVHAKAVGLCYMTEHSGWRCAMADPAPAVQRGQPPPSQGA
jgi:hypothetical protein